MRNFLRALKFCWPYRYRIALSVLFALLAAVLWGLNFTAIYPVLKILGGTSNLQTWAEGSITKLQEERIPPLKDRLAELDAERLEVEKAANLVNRDTRLRRIARELAAVESQLENARTELYYYEVAKRYIDMLMPEGPFATLALVLGMVLIGVAIKGVFEFCQETLVGHVVGRALFDLRNAFYRKAIHLDVASFNNSGAHEMMSRCTNDAETLGTGLRTILGKIIAEPLRVVCCVVLACWISWQLTVMFLVFVPVALLILTKVGRLMKRATRNLLDRMSNIYQILQETFTGIRIVKAFAREAHERRRFRVATNDYYQRVMRVTVLDSLSGPIIELLTFVTVVSALMIGAYLVLEQETALWVFGDWGIRLVDAPIDMEALLQLYVLLGAIADPVRKMSTVYTRIQSGFAAADRIFGFMDRQPKIGCNGQGPRLDRHARSIEFQNVCFSYDPGHPILTGVNLRVEFGQVVALVGKNGCGKTTLLNLVPRFYDPDHGSVLIDGLELRSAHLRTIRKQIGIVTQDTVLFDDTIYNNIAYGKPRATKEEIEAAARQAKAHDYIVKLPKGYETRVGEAGTKLSGGQKQRLSLARAILSNPSILILDEFTSQADAEVELEVHRILRDFMHGRTTFVITHRLNTLEIADRIVVLDQGRIIAEGSHQELLRSCPLYQRLHEAHFQRMVA
jgi:ATP-binding cassette, subfamily B, bacterial MsbA